MSVKDPKSGKFAKKPEPKTEVAEGSLTSMSSPVKRRKKLSRVKTDIIQVTQNKAGTGILHVKPNWVIVKNEDTNSKKFGHTKSDRVGKWSTGGLPRISFKGRSQQAYAAVDKRVDEEIRTFKIPDPDDDTKFVEGKAKTTKGDVAITLIKDGKQVPDEPKDLEALRKKAVQDVETFTKQIKEAEAVQKMRPTDQKS